MNIRSAGGEAGGVELPIAKLPNSTIIYGMKKFLFLIILFLSLLCLGKIWGEEGESEMAFTIRSSAFQEGGTIARIHTCDDRDISPPLSWENPPEGTKSLALICDDPDAPMGTWIHWVLYNLPGSVRKLPEGVPAQAKLKDGTLQGKNDFGRTGYGGPCPPRGKPHRYFFKLYALDMELKLSPGLTKKELLRAIEGHILGQTELFGKYGRS